MHFYNKFYNFILSLYLLFKLNMQDEEKQGIDDALLLGNQKRGIDYYLEQLKLTTF